MHPLLHRGPSGSAQGHRRSGSARRGAGQGRKRARRRRPPNPRLAPLRTPTSVPLGNGPTMPVTMNFTSGASSARTSFGTSPSTSLCPSPADVRRGSKTDAAAAASAAGAKHSSRIVGTTSPPKRRPSLGEASVSASYRNNGRGPTRARQSNGEVAQYLEDYESAQVERDSSTGPQRPRRASISGPSPDSRPDWCHQQPPQLDAEAMEDVVLRGLSPKLQRLELDRRSRLGSLKSAACLTAGRRGEEFFFLLL